MIRTDEWEGFKADMWTAFVSAAILLVALLVWIGSDSGPVLRHDECLPGHKVFVNDELVGCTDDKPTKHPDFVPAYEGQN